MNSIDTVLKLIKEMDAVAEDLGDDPKFQERLEALKDLCKAKLWHYIRTGVSVKNFPVGFTPHNYINSHWDEAWSALNQAEGWDLYAVSGILLIKGLIKGPVTKTDDGSVNLCLEQAMAGSLRHATALYLHGTSHYS